MKIQILLAALGLFALLSGALKSRARVSERLGGIGLGGVEAVMGFVLVISQAPGIANEDLRVALGWGTLGLMAVSNLHAVLRARGAAKGRRDSEGHRLYTQIKFQAAHSRADSGLAGEDEPSDGSPPDADSSSLRG